MLERIVSLVKDIFPDRCIFCSQSGKVICMECMAKMDSARNGKPIGKLPNIDILTSVYRYDSAFPEVVTAVLTMKDKYLRGLFSLMAEQIAGLASSIPLPAQADYVSFLPRSKANLHKAGFDQSAILAREVARRLNLPYAALLKRRGRSSEQKMLSAAERAENVKGKFTAVKKIHCKNVILIDDVLTTGSSASEAAKTLKLSGVEKVFVITLAKR